MNLNGTYIAIDGYVDVKKYRYLYFLIMLAIYIFIMVSNGMIVYLIWTQKNLHEPMYVFIAALSINSIMFSTAIYPKLLIDFLSDRQVISYQACLFQYFLFYVLSGADFLLLAAMAYDRYVSICKPLLYPTIMRRRTVIILLLYAWIMPACQLAVGTVLNAMERLCNFSLKGVFCNNTIFKLHCETSKLITVYGLIGLSHLVVLPVLFILFTYIKILVISYRSNRDIRNKATETCLPHLLVLICISVLCTYDVIKARLEPDASKLFRLIMTLQIIVYNPLLNPIIYGVKMKEISKHLKKLLCKA